MEKKVTITLPGGEMQVDVDSNREQADVNALVNSIQERAESPIRALSAVENELYQGAVRSAVVLMPAFRDALALLRPFFDLTAQTAYTDRYARVGLAPWFFFLPNRERATVVLHECMHVMNGHFLRAEAMGAKSGKLFNIAGDFEINSGLAMLQELRMGKAILPEMKPFEFERYKSMEQYYLLLDRWDKEQKKDQCQCQDSNDSQPQDGDGEGEGQGQGEGAGEGQGNGSPGQGSDGAGQPGGNSGSGGSQSGEKKPGQDSCPNCGKQRGEGDAEAQARAAGEACDPATEGRESAADDAGIARASETEKNVAKRNTSVRIVEEMKKQSLQPGSNPMYDFLQMAHKRLQPPKVNWRTILQRKMSLMNDQVCKGRADYSYRRNNRRMATVSKNLVFPGMVTYEPTLYFGIDTSGSMTTQDYNSLLSEVEGIVKRAMRSKNGIKVFMIDTDIKSTKTVKSVKDIKLTGGGGTEMDMGVRYINSLPPKEIPDIFILATDGGTLWKPYIEALRAAPKKYLHILLITDKHGAEGVPDELKRLCTVIDISPEA